MKLLQVLVLVLMVGLVSFWKCPINYWGIPEDAPLEEEQGYFILNCTFYPEYKDRMECNDLAKYLSCSPYRHKKVKKRK